MNKAIKQQPYRRITMDQIKAAQRATAMRPSVIAVKQALVVMQRDLMKGVKS